MRMCKFKMNKNIAPNPTYHIDTCDFQSPVWTMHYAHGDISVLNKIYPDIDRKDLLSCNALQQNIRTFALPADIAEQQRTALVNTFGACHFSTNAMKYFHVCCTCVVNGKVRLFTQPWTKMCIIYLHELNNNS
jgi:hypothetical protein